MGRFAIFVIVSLIAFVAILLFVTRGRNQAPSTYRVAIIAAVVVVGGMYFAKFGENSGLPWWIYYTAPALATLILPPVAFRFSRHELWRYLLLAFLSSPVIHVLFSFFLGWPEYMPFIPVPSLRSVLT